MKRHSNRATVHSVWFSTQWPYITNIIVSQTLNIQVMKIQILNSYIIFTLHITLQQTSFHFTEKSNKISVYIFTLS